MMYVCVRAYLESACELHNTSCDTSVFTSCSFPTTCAHTHTNSHSRSSNDWLRVCGSESRCPDPVCPLLSPVSGRRQQDGWRGEGGGTREINKADNLWEVKGGYGYWGDGWVDYKRGEETKREARSTRGRILNWIILYTRILGNREEYWWMNSGCRGK